MIYFLNLDGTCTRQDTDHIYQGSNNVNKVIAVTSISPVQTYVQAAFTLPSSLTVGYLPMAYKGAYDVKDSNAKIHVWELDLTANVTEVQGTVGISFNVVNRVTGANMTSYTNTFEVEYSALPLPPPNPSQSEWEQLLALLQSYAAVNPIIVEKLENFQIGTVTAKASESGAQPQVTAEIINQSVPNRYLLDLDFTLPRGEQGAQGNAPDITMTASVDNGAGEPNVEVTKSGTNENPIFDLAFQNLKGDTGQQALTFTGPTLQFTSDPTVDTFPVPSRVSLWNRTPVLGDEALFLATYNNEGYLLNARIIQISDAICTARTTAYIKTGIIGSNPNLLINPDSAINQRGITTLSQGTGYMSDRWYKMAGSNSNRIDIENGTYTITITGVSSSWAVSRALTQAIECSESLWGKQVTFSVNVIEPAQNNDFSMFIYALNAQKGIMDQTQEFVYLNTAGLKYATFTVPQNTVYLQVAIDGNFRNGTIGNFVKFNEPKLEIGTVATPFSPPNIAEELSKCQRYYIDTCYQIKSDLAPYALGSGLCFSASFAYFVVPIPTSMRVSAAQVSSKNNIDNLVVLVDGQTLPITAITVIGSNNTSITIRATGTFEIGSAAVLRVKAGENALGILAFDAEI